MTQSVEALEAPQGFESSIPCYLLSVDPGTHSAWALWESSPLGWSLKRFGRLEKADALTIFDWMGTLLPTWSTTLVLVEGQWFSPGKSPGGFRSVERIIESRCAWQDAALIAGADVSSPAVPGVWIREMTRGAPGKTPDERIKFVCKRVFPGLGFVADEHAAVLLGVWWCQQHGGVARD